MNGLSYPEEERAAFLVRYAPAVTSAERAKLRAEVWTAAAIDNAIQFGF